MKCSFAFHRFARPSLTLIAWAAVVSLLFASSACGNSVSMKTPSTDDPDAEVTEEIDPELRELDGIFRRAECAKMYECCSSQERREVFNVTYSQEECLERTGLLPLNVGLAILDEAEKAGRIAINWTQAELCANSFIAQDCTVWDEVEPAATKLPGCQEMIEPKVGLGEECYFDDECITGFCLSDHTTDDIDTCAEKPGEGADCSDHLCGSDRLYCETFENICRLKLREGSSCIRAQECLTGNCQENEDMTMSCGPARALCEG